MAVALVAVACCVFASAEDTNLALGKSYTIDGYDYDASVENYVDNETHSKLTDGIVEDVAPWDAGAPFIGISGAEKETPAEEHNGLTTAIVLDLGAVSTVNKFAVQLFGGGNEKLVEIFLQHRQRDLDGSRCGIAGERFVR